MPPHVPQPPPLWQSLLLESPWLLVIALAAGGLIVRLAARQRGHRRLAHAGWIGPGLALLVWALSHLVQTGREQLLAHSRDLVASTAPIQPPHLLAMLRPDAVLVGPDGQTWLDGPALRAELESQAGRLRIASQSIRSIEAQTLGDGQGVALLDLRTTLAEGFGAQAPIASKWLLTWRQEDGVWRLQRVQWLELMNRPARMGAWR